MYSEHLGRTNVGNLLATAPMVYIGKISYSLYLWHVMVIFGIELIAPGMVPGTGLVWFLLVSALSVALSTVTYLLVERPSNQWGKTLARHFARAT